MPQDIAVKICGLRRPEEVADLIAYLLAQPKRTLFKNVSFVPVVEQW